MRESFAYLRKAQQTTAKVLAGLNPHRLWVSFESSWWTRFHGSLIFGVDRNSLFRKILRTVSGLKSWTKKMLIWRAGGRSGESLKQWKCILQQSKGASCKHGGDVDSDVIEIGERPEELLLGQVEQCQKNAQTTQRHWVVCIVEFTKVV